MNQYVDHPSALRRLAARLACVLLLAAAAAGCVKDPAICPPEAEGQEASVSLSWSLADMTPVTRTLSSDAAARARTVNTLWVGIFSATSGSLTGTSGLLDCSHADEHTYRTLSDIKALSGASYIVAVANPSGNYGTTDNAALLARMGSDAARYDLAEMLAQVTTWEEYRSIAAVQDDARNIASYSSNLVMAGVYLADNTDRSGAEWIKENGAVTLSAGTNNLSGAIHLRRLLAHIEFNITAGKHDGKPVTVLLETWRVHNNPFCSYLHEQQSNAADELQHLFAYDELFEDASAGSLRHNYTDAHPYYDPTHTTKKTETGEDADFYSFDFYQYENKHEGLECVTQYADREREFKRDSASGFYPANGLNTGVYTSLCETGKPPISQTSAGGPRNLNNFASFVEMRAKVSYEVVENGTTYTRTGDVTYVVHLGYCEGKGDEVLLSRDFNCRRNTDYTYNITINGVDQIVVEVDNGAENQPGAEGIVTDTKETPIQLDAHYNVFNISFTEKELEALDYHVDAYFAGQPYSIGSNETDIDVDTAKEIPFYKQFYGWVSFKPTKNERLLRRFKDTYEPDYDVEEGLPAADPKVDEDLLYLEDLKTFNVEDHPFGKDENENYWFTVFVREYVYYYGPDNGGKQLLWNAVGGEYTETGWENYIEQNDRVVDLAITQRNTSADQESAHLYSKYKISQLSIQSYYDATAATQQGDGTALGAEHVNESYGLNMGWSFERPSKYTTSNWSQHNGRWNMYSQLNGEAWSTVLLEESETDKSNKSYTFNVAEKNPEITGRKNASSEGSFSSVSVGDYEYRAATQYCVPALVPAGTRSGAFDPNPSVRNYYEALYACMSRNRDINGNGIIDANEIRWFLPTAGKYLRLVIGAHSLRNPLIKISSIDPSQYSAGSENGAFHFITSEGYYLWTEEGASLDGWGGITGAIWYTAWELRCVRNLGCQPPHAPSKDTDPVQNAYVLDKANRTIAMSYYDPNILRGEKLSYIPSHKYSERDAVQPYKKFQYAADDCKGLSDGTVTVESGGNISSWSYDNWTTSLAKNGICGQYTEETGGGDKGTWRVPTQIELTILRRIHQRGSSDENGDAIFKDPGTVAWKWLSCTTDFLSAQTISRYCGIIWCRRENYNYWTNSPAYEEYNRVRCVRDVD